MSQNSEDGSHTDPRLAENIKTSPKSPDELKGQKSTNERKNTAKNSENVQKSLEECTEDDFDSGSPDKSKAKKCNSGPSQPNHFIAFQVSDKDVRSKVSEVQEKMLQKEGGKIFKETMSRLEKLHVTLYVFHLKGQEEIQTAIRVLEEFYLKIKDELKNNPLVVNIQGMGEFSNVVLFAKIEGDAEKSRLEELHADLRAEYEKINIIGVSSDFKPHMTMANMSRFKKLPSQEFQSFPPGLWADFKSEHFGHQRVESLELLAMGESDPVTGYYPVVAQFDFPV